MKKNVFIFLLLFPVLCFSASVKKHLKRLKQQEKNRVEHEFKQMWSNNRGMYCLFYYYVNNGKTLFNEPEWFDLKYRYGLVSMGGAVFESTKSHVHTFFNPRTKKGFFLKKICSKLFHHR